MLTYLAAVLFGLLVALFIVAVIGFAWLLKDLWRTE